MLGKILTPLSVIYRIGNELDKIVKLSFSVKLSKPVISVGNLEFGGTGKSPLVEYIAQILSSRGLKVAILSRGYKGHYRGIVRSEMKEAGDEARMFAKDLNDVVVSVHPDRRKAARIIEMSGVDVDLYILDDGFQHYVLRRELDIVLLDWRYQGYPNIFPKGRLRENISSLKRADIVIFTRASSANFPHAWTDIREYYKGMILYFDFAVENITFESKILPEGKRYFLITGIAKPQYLLNSLKEKKINIVGYEFFPDHHNFIEKDFSEALKNKVDHILVTKKDKVKIDIPVAVVESGIKWHGTSEEKLWERINNYV